MCGIAGYHWHDWQEDSAEVLTRMANAIRHRGPDNSGMWVDSEKGIGFAHRRLAILDPTPAGDQPMQSVSGQYVIVFNGEIYNHLTIRAELEKQNAASNWRGHSDTETLLAAFECWGIEATLQRANGMFALAVWDRRSDCLTLARDRMGEKPLYYGWQGSGTNSVFLFGSELKALKQHPRFEGKINRGAVSLLLRHSYIPTPYSIYEKLFKLPPGHLIVLGERDFIQHSLPEPKPYWSLVDVVHAGVERPWQGSEVAAIDQLDSVLRNAVGQQMVADVPLGAFLSGGVDSSTIVALMQAQSAQPIKTFSIGFKEESYNEAGYAKAVANYLGTDHTELYVSPDEALAVIPKLPTLYDEPFSDSSQIPTYLVAQLAKQRVTVSLSGDAGDELFCGYNRYLMSSALWKKMQLIPLGLRKLAGKLLTSASPDRWDQLGRYLPFANRYVNFGDTLHKSAAVLGSRDLDGLYLGLISHWDEPADIVLQGLEPPTLSTKQPTNLLALDGVQKMMVLDALTYLSDDILVKVDRAAMGCSLETRVPFLDHRVVEFAWTLPQSLKIRDGKSKWILREVLYRHVPKELIERPKMGFGVPIAEWLRGPLRDWAESLIDEARLRREGFFNPVPIRLKWSEHLSGKRNWQHHLWDVLMFQAWLEKQ